MTARLSLWLVLLCVAPGCAREPDVLVLFVDTLRADRLGCSQPLGHVPALEQFMGEGVCFERVASTSGWTLPTETSMLFSTYPAEHGVTARHSEVDTSLVGITTPLLDEGYRTALFSGNVLTSHPHYQHWFDELWVIDKQDEFAADVDTRVVDEALLWLAEERRRDPVFFVLQLYGPHHPYCPPGVDDGVVDVPDFGEIDLCSPLDQEALRTVEDEELDLTGLAARAEELYDAEVAYTAAEIERFVLAWDEIRTRDRVTVVVTDHGEAFGEHGTWLHGRSLHYETSDCVLAFHGEGVPTQVVDRPVELLDLAPTLLSVLGLQSPAGWRGLDLTPLFDDPDRAFEARAYQVSDLQDVTQWAVTLEGDDGHRYRMLAWEDTDARELYDETEDPSETINLADEASHATIREQLETLLEEMRLGETTGGPAREP